jgi:hypothetical protein
MQQLISSTTQNENKAKEREREREKKKTSSPENTILLDSGTEMQKRKQIQTQN